MPAEAEAAAAGGTERPKEMSGSEWRRGRRPIAASAVDDACSVGAEKDSASLAQYAHTNRRPRRAYMIKNGRDLKERYLVETLCEIDRSERTTVPLAVIYNH